ncbi:hypothetical protein B0H16DRAFT_1472370 [Mycena metata]|uniref:Uncharacterized protein n=1 Tax=Mycena metata TaxID=1033252 RepID=A0AAD7HPF3_9AGAR|nr:hypothetical protein B0H16DRAFT_1472370 [Mycena metata]
MYLAADASEIANGGPAITTDGGGIIRELGPQERAAQWCDRSMCIFLGDRPFPQLMWTPTSISSIPVVRLPVSNIPLLRRKRRSGAIAYPPSQATDEDRGSRRARGTMRMLLARVMGARSKGKWGKMNTCSNVFPAPASAFGAWSTGEALIGRAPSYDED